MSGRFSAPGGLTALFGRSGAGKTTLVNIIAGLVRARRARVVVGSTVLVDTEAGILVPPHRRRIGTVFQEGRLFPHLSVRQNLLFGRWFARRRERSADLASVVDLLGIGPLLSRRPATLSGGEKQRVAIGRALLAEPRLLLMDEPLTALDDARKAEILPYIERLRDAAGVPIVYVSHSVAEVARLADTLVLLDQGRIAASGAAGPLLASLDAGPLAGIREAGAVLDARVVSHDTAFGLTRLSTPAGDIEVPRIARPPGARLRLQVHARDVMLSLAPPAGLSALNVLAATVEAVPAQDGAVGRPTAVEHPTVDVRLDCSGVPLLARITRKSLDRMALAPGLPVFAIVKSVAFDVGRDGGAGLAPDDGSM